MAYKAYTREQAMQIASAIVKADMLGKDDDLTESNGMPVYIYEDGSRLYDGSGLLRPVISLEIDKGPEGIRYDNIDIVPLYDIADYVDMQVKLICIRAYENGCSRDRWYPNTDHVIMYALKAIMLGAINSYMEGYTDPSQSANVAEFQARQLGFDKVNLRETVYNPVKYAPIDKIKK